MVALSTSASARPNLCTIDRDKPNSLMRNDCSDPTISSVDPLAKPVGKAQPKYPRGPDLLYRSRQRLPISSHFPQISSVGVGVPIAGVCGHWLSIAATVTPGTRRLF